jgi:hypothetical protein
MKRLLQALLNRSLEKEHLINEVRLADMYKKVSELHNVKRLRGTGRFPQPELYAAARAHMVDLYHGGVHS